jgi:hypothetical protein
MSLALPFVLTLAVKMGVTAAFVVIASMVAERAGPLVGAMVSTLPISAGPAYVFLALDHEPAFIAGSAVTSLAMNAATAAFAVTYAMLAQRRGLALSLSVALGLWLLVASAIEFFHVSLMDSVIVNAAVFAVCVPLARLFQHAKMPVARRRWYDVPLRAGLVACLVTTVVGLSTQVGSAVTGILAVFPIVLTSLMLILQPRVGGPAAAAVIAHTIWGLVGFAVALTVLHAMVIPVGAPAALASALAVSIGWNVMVWVVRRRGVAGGLRRG